VFDGFDGFEGFGGGVGRGDRVVMVGFGDVDRVGLRGGRWRSV
jgi:hypothetical protein